MNAAPWHRTEPRDVRPFFGAAAAEQALSGTKIKVFDGEGPTDADVIDVGPEDVAKLSIVLFPCLAPVETWLPEGYTAKDLSVVIVAGNALIKRSKIIFNMPVHLFSDGQEVEVDPSTLAYLGGGRGIRFTAAVALTTERAPILGEPFLIGHWLATREFHLRDKSIESLFDIRPRTDEEWVEAGYPPKTTYSVRYTAGISSEVDDNSSVAIVYVHADAYNKMTTDRLGDVLQPLLAADIVAQIIEQSRADWEKLSEVPQDSPLETVLKGLGDTKINTLAELKKAHPSMLRAVLHQELGVTKAISAGQV